MCWEVARRKRFQVPNSTAMVVDMRPPSQDPAGMGCSRGRLGGLLRHQGCSDIPNDESHGPYAT